MKKILKHALVILLISFFALLPWIYGRYRIHKKNNVIFTNGKIPQVSSCPRCRIGLKRPKWIDIRVIDGF